MKLDVKPVTAPGLVLIEVDLSVTLSLLSASVCRQLLGITVITVCLGSIPPMRGVWSVIVILTVLPAAYVLSRLVNAHVM